MRVAFSLPALRAYRDRLQMVCALSDLVDELYLLTDEVDDETARAVSVHPHLIPVSLGRKGFKKAAFDWLYAKTRTQGIDIVHDTFGHLSGFFRLQRLLNIESFVF